MTHISLDHRFDESGSSEEIWLIVRCTGVEKDDVEDDDGKR